MSFLAVPGAAATASAAQSPASTPARRGTGIFGQVRSVLDGRPVAGARIGIAKLGRQSTSDANGHFVLPAPPGAYLVTISATGFIEAIQPDQTVREGYTALNVSLVPRATSEAQQQAIYSKVVRQTESPLLAPSPRSLSRLSASLGLPSTITIYYDKWNPPQYIQVPLEDYVKGVVPNEVPASWPIESLKAQAVASRSYGVASYLARGYVYPDTRSQVYNPNNRTAATDAAVDATAAQVLTYGGAVITALFFSRCNGATTVNSENAISLSVDPGTNLYICGTLGWNYVAYCRARSCTGHSPSTKSNCGYYGHGVGMCQWGSYYQGTSGVTYDAILSSYYTNTTLQNAGIGTPTPLGPFLVQSNQPFTLSWASVGSGASYSVTIQPSGGSIPVATYYGTATSWSVQGLGAGTYTWTITAYLNNQYSSAGATITAADDIRKVYLPIVGM